MMDREELIYFLDGGDDPGLFRQSASVKERNVGSKVYLRGLIELSNRCMKNCYYCGIRGGNTVLERYDLTQEQILDCARYALDRDYGSVVLQAGERQDSEYVLFIEKVIKAVKDMSDGRLAITLSLGEQSEDTYRRWFDAGADRYLLRIETSDPALYAALHPASHSFAERLRCLEIIRKTGYQTGTGVMIGLPWQTTGQLADDLLFMRRMDIDMCGMGPFIENSSADITLTGYSYDDRFALSLRMIALLRISMPKINIASTTALHTLRPDGRQQGIRAGANVIMPNITPPGFREGYRLYDNKPLEDTDLTDFDVAFGEQGNSLKYMERQQIADNKK